ncbi:MAG: hypothetical protein HFJ28_06850 [Clostridia bacterium]|jgi:putative transposase|nr:hypothetical protein [Clostridia bacterium]
MPRIARNDLNTSFFHVIIQGVNKECIFKQNIYKEKYLQFLKEANLKFNIKIIAYCVMDNHVHLLIYTFNIKQLSSFMKQVNENFARYYNYKRERIGHVFRDRFLSEAIYNENYLKNCLVYIHNNPVKAKIVKNCIDYPYSSYQDYLKKQDFIDEKCIELIFHTKHLKKEEYDNMHLKKFYFMDYQDTIESDVKELVEEYSQNIERNSVDINKEKLVIYIKQRLKISNRQLAKYLSIDKSKISRILRQ